MNQTVAAVAGLRREAAQRGLRPIAIEVGPEHEAAQAAASIFGIEVRPRDEPGLELLALPARHIGRLECALPVRLS